MIKRECGSCSLCCRVMGVPEVKKDHEWCRHAAPGHGCKIYQDRPEACRSFSCMWLLDEKLPDYWKPEKSKIVVNALIENGISYVAFVVDLNCPTRWREKPWIDDIRKIAKAGLEGRLGEKWTTIISIGGEKIPIIGSERLLRAG